MLSVCLSVRPVLTADKDATHALCCKAVSWLNIAVRVLADIHLTADWMRRLHGQSARLPWHSSWDERERVLSLCSRRLITIQYSQPWAARCPGWPEWHRTILQPSRPVRSVVCYLFSTSFRLRVLLLPNRSSSSASVRRNPPPQLPVSFIASRLSFTAPFYCRKCYSRTSFD